MPLILEFGCRGGSWLALAFFSLIFGALGVAIAREVRLRSGGAHTMLGRLFGWALFAGVMASIYAAMLSGFYDAEVTGNTLRLRYLHPSVGVEVPLSETTIRVAPAYRDRARLVLTARGADHASAPARRSDVEDAMRRLNETHRP